MSVLLFHRGLKRSVCLYCRRLPCQRSSSSAALYLQGAAPPDSSSPQWDSNNTEGPPSTGEDAPGSIGKVDKTRKSERKVKVEKPIRNLLEQTKVEEYLDYVAATRTSVALEDIENCRPPKHALPGTQQYQVEYTSLVETLMRSFSTHQLRTFLDLYNLNLPMKRTKRNMVIYIIEHQWKWPSLAKIQKEQRDWTEVSKQTFPLDPRQSFLILGKDGADLFSLSLKYNVHISFSAKPLSLKVEGLRGSLDKFSHHINELNSAVADELLELPTKNAIKFDLLQRMSRLSGAFVENIGNGIVRISYKKTEPRAALMAKRLAMRAACEASTRAPILSYIPPAAPVSISSTPTYSLYPFLPSRNLPWMTGAGDLFRVKRVVEGLGGFHAENVEETGGLSDGRGSMITLDETTSDIKSAIMGTVPFLAFAETSTGSNRVITASLGHLLIRCPPTRHANITPPYMESQQLPDILKGIDRPAFKFVFAPSLPPSLLGASPSRQRILHRLVYRAIPTPSGDSSVQEPSAQVAKILKFEFVVGLSKQSTDAQTNDLDVYQDVDSVPLLLEVDKLADQGTTIKHKVTSAHQCWVGSERTLDLMMPDRPMDIRFSLLNYTEISIDQWPEDLQQYNSKLEAFLSFTDEQATQPDTPLTLAHQGLTYILQSSSSVRQNIESTPATDASSTSTNIISESALDLESNEKATSCLLTCEDIASPDIWHNFLRNCDWLSSRPSTNFLAGSTVSTERSTL